MGPVFGPQKLPDLSTGSAAVDAVVSAENLRSVASATADPQVLLGLACLARAGSPARQEIAAAAAKARPEYAPIVPVVSLTMDGVDEQRVNELISRDPDNALGHYLQATLLYGADRDAEALVAFRKAAHCSELRLYEPITGEAIFRALDALRLAPRDRLVALCWMANRRTSFSSAVLQFLSWPLSELGRRGDGAFRAEAADLLLVLAGHLFTTNYDTRWSARQALDSAVFGLGARVPEAGKFTTVVASGGVAQALIGAMLRWPGGKAQLNVDEPMNPLRQASYLPDRVHRAFAVADPDRAGATYAGDSHVKLPASARGAFERAKQQAMTAAQQLIDLVLSDADRILGAYLKGIPHERDSDGRVRVARESPVEMLLRERPEVFAAVAANERAMGALWDAGAVDPGRRNRERMMEVGRAIFRYAADHDETYPENLEVLFEKGYLKRDLKPNSLVTGRPYVYVAAGEKVPVKGNVRARFVVLYDDNVDQWGVHACVFASWIGGAITPAELEAQLRNRGK